MNRAVKLFIFDADNTLRRTTVLDQPCPYRPGEWELMPNVRQVLASVQWGAAGVRLGIASNQDRVAYGFLSRGMAERLLRDMVHAAVGAISPAPRIELCPHAIEMGCPCRKPAPLMLTRIVDHFGVPSRDTLFVGDAETDRLAARSANVRFAWAWDFFQW